MMVEPLEPDDTSLMAKVRNGRPEAFAELYRRHGAAASAYAGRLVRGSDDAGDVVAEAFTRVLALLQRGRGPSGAFAPYLMRTLRNTAYDRSCLVRRVVVTDCDAVLDRPTTFEDPVIARLERDLAGQAYASLPSRWREVLRLTCIEGVSVDEVAARLSMSATALTSLTYRAREGLRRAYLQAHVPDVESPDCRQVSSRYGSFVRGGTRSSALGPVAWHLKECSACREVIAELRSVNDGLRDRPSRGSGASDRVITCGLRVGGPERDTEAERLVRRHGYGFGATLDR